MVVKKMIGDDLFTDNWEKARRQITKRRADRRKNMDELAVTDPELFNQIKIRKQEKETARRKRRLEEKKLNPSGTAKVKKLNTVESLWKPNEKKTRKFKCKTSCFVEWIRKTAEEIRFRFHRPTSRRRECKGFRIFKDFLLHIQSLYYKLIKIFKEFSCLWKINESCFDQTSGNSDQIGPTSKTWWKTKMFCLIFLQMLKFLFW